MKKIRIYILAILLSLGIILNLVPLALAGVSAIPGAREITSVSNGAIS